MHFVYCIYSHNFNKTYIGRTSNLEGRLTAHNHPSIKGYTKRYQPWILVYSEKYDTLREVSLREKYLKTGAGRDFIKSLLKDKI